MVKKTTSSKVKARNETGLAQSLLSHHLRVLRDAKFVRVAKRGRNTAYELFPGVKASDTEMILVFGRCRLLLC